MKGLKITRTGSSFEGRLQLPGSKSISNRLLIIKALSGSKIYFNNLSEADDTLRLRKSLKLIKTCSVSDIPLVVDAGHAGTVMRFLTAFLSQYPGKWLLTGSQRMMQRPIGPLVEALQSSGACIKYAGKMGFPPLIIKGKSLAGGKMKIKSSVSSQFISALMLIAPYLQKGLDIRFEDSPVSFSYLKMTAGIMEQMGVSVHLYRNGINILPGIYKVNGISVEADWSSAAFWYQLVALGEKTKISLKGLFRNSVQGDSALAFIFQKLGVKTVFEPDGITLSNSGKRAKKIDFDFSDCPDIVPSVMATCQVLGVTAVFRGIEHLRYKESDRIAKMEEELGKTGTIIRQEKKSYRLIPGNIQVENLLFHTHNDHRLAMSLAPLALKYPQVVIANPDVVGKSFPSYWDEFQKTGMFNMEEVTV